LRRGVFLRIVRRLKAKMMREMERWEKREGIAFLKRVGIREGDTVLDFGARVGHYTIPAAAAVGPKGKVYAFDKDPKALAELVRKKAVRDVDNIVTVETTGETGVNLADASVDLVLLYDVLHLMPAVPRRALYKEAARVLKDSGVLSVYPKHVAEDGAADYFKDLTAEDVMREICSPGFVLRDTVCGRLSHDDTVVAGCVWNFEKVGR